jgi:hypothetical protein
MIFSSAVISGIPKVIAVGRKADDLASGKPDQAGDAAPDCS